MASHGKKQAQPVAGAIEALISSIGLSSSYHGWMVVERWPEIVGEHVARRAHAYRYDDGTLFVAVKDAAWRQNLAMELDTILGHIRSYSFGRAIARIRLTAGERGK